MNGIQRLTYKFTNNLVYHEETGTRYAFLTEGIYEASGTLERFYTGSSIWPWFGSTKGETSLDNCILQIFPAGRKSGQHYIQINGIKLNTTATSHRPAANLMLETWDFMATGSITTSQFSLEFTYTFPLMFS